MVILQGEVIFQLTHWASDGETLELRPTSNLLLFDPPTLSVTMRAGTIATSFDKPEVPL